MAQQNRTTIKTFFETGDIPTEAQFGDSFDSQVFWQDDVETTLGTTDTKVPTSKAVNDAMVFTKDAENNVFYNGVTATLGSNSSQNIFHQGTNITLGDDCKANIFEPRATPYIFGNGLTHVTVKSGAYGADYTDLTNYGFMYNLPYPSEIFRNPENTANYHSYYDPTNNRIVLTNLTTLAVSFIGGGGDVYLANDQTFTGENTFSIGSGNDTPVTITKGGNNAALKVTKSSGSGDAIEVAQGSLSIADETASRIAIFDSNKRVKSGNTSTYPSLTEIEHVKGVTSAIQTQFTNINNRLANLIDIGTDGAATSGTSNTYSTGGLITPAQILAGDCIEILTIVRKSNTLGTLTVRLYANTTNDLSGSPILIGATQAYANTTRQTSFQRFIRIKVKNGTGAATEVTNTSLTNAADNSGIVTNAPSTLLIDWTVNQYLIVAIQNGSGSESSVSTMFKVRR